MVLPNGQLYSLKALEEMSKKQNGKVTCPTTQQTYKWSELRKAFIV